MIRAALAALLLLAAGAACGGGEGDGAGEVTVFAASSLTDAFTELASAFERDNPGTTVALNFASSSSLAVQLNEGAPADVFASANRTQMEVAVEGGGAGSPVVFATNSLVVAVPAKSSAVGSWDDLANDDVILVLAAEEVPVGDFARAAIAAAGAEFEAAVLANVRSNEANVRAVLTKVQLGEADAGIVYRTDIAAAQGEVTAIDVPAEYNQIAVYPIAPATGGENPDGAAAFIGFVLSPAGQAILASNGFGWAP